MSEITILSPHVADLIAAGEVVERPASVIKELIENSFDAGAKNITVEIKGGGMTYIKVTDDGCGMFPEDAGMCFMRHATSKLRDERGLECIGTMGFRGEALAAISSVSRIELMTRRKGTDTGTRVVLEAGDIVEMTPFGCPEGTTMIVRDLFHNTPARLKFMKSDRTEGSACLACALRCALGRPDVSVRFLKDGEEGFFSPGDGKINSCAYSLLGRETALEFLECESSADGVSVAGFVGSPKAAHGNRAKQFFFCNGRNIKSQLLQTAVEQAYKNTLLTGRYPSCVIYLCVSPAAVDVNVHPAKTEVKFRDERQVFDVVYYAALSALERAGSPGETKTPNLVISSVPPKKDFFKSMNSSEFREKYAGPQKPADPVGFSSTAGSSSYGLRSAASKNHAHTIVWNRNAGFSGSLKMRESESPYRISAIPEDSGGTHNVSVSEAAFDVSVPPCESSPCAKQDESTGSIVEVIPETLSRFRIIGEAMKTYIIVEKDDELIFIDKHAAHERMIFDSLKRQGHEIMSQALLVPVTLRLSAEEIELIEKNTEHLSQLGFEIEPYGSDSVILRSVPAETAVSDASAMVEEICEKLKKNFSLSPDEKTDDILHTIACKAAIKAGWDTSQEELSKIAEEVLSGKVRYCPHGRPVSVTFTKKQLDKEFSRIL